MSFKENVKHKADWQNTLQEDNLLTPPKVIVWDYRNLDSLETFWFSDVHLGHHACSEDRFKANVDFVGENQIPSADIGDLIENATRDSVGAGVYDQETIAQVQLEKAVELYTPIKHLLKSMQPGNHESVVKDTDILTSNGWINITEVDGLKLAQFDINSGEISFEKPTKIIKHFAKELFIFESPYMKQVVTERHDLIIDNKKINARDIKKINESQLRLSGNHKGKSNFSDEDIALLTWVIMDGTIVDYKKYNPKSKKIRIQFKLSKKRKIEELKELLDSLDINYTFKECKKNGVNRLQPYYIRVYGDEARRINYLLNGKKQIPNDWKNFNRTQLRIFLDILEKTDAHYLDGSLRWTTINKNNLDIVQEACIKNNFIAKYVKKYGAGFENGKIQYHVTIKDINSTFKKHEVKINKIKYNDYAYCVEMPKGTIIIRLDGKVAFTGNSRTYNKSGVNLTRIMAKMLGVPYVGAGVMHYLMVGNQRYVGYSHHGGSGATTTGGKFNAIKRPAGFIDADFIISGHLHDTIYYAMDSFYLDTRSRTVKKRTKHLIQNGSYLNWWNTYGQVKAYEPGTKGNALVKFDGNKKNIEVKFR